MREEGEGEGEGVGAGYEGERAAPGGVRVRSGSRSRRGAGRAVAGRRCRSRAQRRTAPVRASERKEKGLPLRVGPAVREGGEGRGLGLGAAQVEAGRLGWLGPKWPVGERQAGLEKRYRGQEGLGQRERKREKRE